MCHLCIGVAMRRSIGFEATRAPRDIEETISRVLNAVGGAIRGVRSAKKDIGRSRRQSASSTLVGFGAGDEENGRALFGMPFPTVCDGGELCGFRPKTLHGAAIAFDIEGHNSAVVVAMLGNADV